MTLKIGNTWWNQFKKNKLCKGSR